MLTKILTEKFLWFAGIFLLMLQIIFLMMKKSVDTLPVEDCTKLVCSFIMAAVTYIQMSEAEKEKKIPFRIGSEIKFADSTYGLPPNGPRDFFNLFMLKFFPVCLLIYICLIHCLF